MPIYSYFCKKCNKKFDLLIGMSQEKVKLCCPYCCSDDIEKLFSSFAIATNNLKIDGSNSKCSGCSGGSCSTCS